MSGPRGPRVGVEAGGAGWPTDALGEAANAVGGDAALIVLPTLSASERDPEASRSHPPGAGKVFLLGSVGKQGSLCGKSARSHPESREG